VFANQQQQAVAAIEITAVKTDVGLVKMGLNCLHAQDF
jgi:flagellar hook protein FlgE